MNNDRFRVRRQYIGNTHEDVITTPSESHSIPTETSLIRATLPIYMTIEKKRSKNKTVLLGMNLYRNAHYTLQNNMKKFVAREVSEQLMRYRGLEWERYTINYVLWYKNVQSDGMNILSFGDKAFADVLQTLRIVSQDSVKYYVGGRWKVGGRDKENPRLEAVVQREM